MVNKIRWKKIAVLMTLVVLILSNNIVSVKAENNSNIFTPVSPVQIFKVWYISLNQEIDPKSINKNVVVLDKNRQAVAVEVELGSDSKSIIVKPPFQGYEYDQKYTLIIKKDIKNSKGKTLKQEIQMSFQTESAPLTVGEAEIYDNIVTFDKSQQQTIFEKIEEVEQDESGEMTLKLKKDENLLSKLENDDIFILNATNEYPLGFIGKVVEVDEKSSKKELIITQPSIEEVFSELDVEIQRNLSPHDLVATEAIDGVEVVFETEKETAQKSNNVAALDNVGSTLGKKQNHEVYLSPKGNFGVNIDELVIYDHDNDKQKNIRENTKAGQVLLSGKFYLQDPILDLKFKYNTSILPPFVDFEQLRAKISGNIHNEINVYSELYNLEYGIGELRKSKNETSMFGYSLQGVKPDKKKLVLATAMISPGAVPVTVKTGEAISVPLGLTIEFTVTNGGRVSAQVEADITNDIYFEKGFDIKFDGVEVKKITPYDIVEPTVNVGLNANGEISSTMGVGVDFNFVVLGIVPAKVTTDLQLENKIKGAIGINVTYKDGLGKLISGCAEFNNTFQLKSEGLIRLALVKDGKIKVEVGGAGTIPIYKHKFWEDKDSICVKPKITYEQTDDDPTTFLFDSKESESRLPLTKYEWSIKKVNSKKAEKLSGQQIEYTFPDIGEYEVELKLTDTNGSFNTITEKIQVTDNVITVKEAKKRSRFTTEMKDAEGKEYTVYFLGINDKKRLAKQGDLWSAVGKDVIYEGDFQMGIQPKNSKFVQLQSDIIKNYKYNSMQNGVYTIPSNTLGQPSLLFISTREASVAYYAYAYYLKDGSIYQVKLKQGGYEFDALGYFIPPKAIGKNKIQVIDYYNADPFGWEFVTYEFNLEKGLFEYKGSKEYFDKLWDKGNQEVDKWMKNPDYYVETSK